MALSNIFREPRREITESIVGLIVAIGPVTAFCIADYYGAVWASVAWFDGTTSTFWGCAIVLIPMCIFGIVFFGWLALILTHAIGDDVCDALEERGLQLRPRDRYR